MILYRPPPITSSNLITTLLRCLSIHFLFFTFWLGLTIVVVGKIVSKYISARLLLKPPYSEMSFDVTGGSVEYITRFTFLTIPPPCTLVCDNKMVNYAQQNPSPLRFYSEMCPISQETDGMSQSKSGNVVL